MKLKKRLFVVEGVEERLGEMHEVHRWLSKATTVVQTARIRDSTQNSKR